MQADVLAAVQYLAVRDLPFDALPRFPRQVRDFERLFHWIGVVPMEAVCVAYPFSSTDKIAEPLHFPKPRDVFNFAFLTAAFVTLACIDVAFVIHSFSFVRF